MVLAGILVKGIIYTHPYLLFVLLGACLLYFRPVFFYDSVNCMRRSWSRTAFTAEESIVLRSLTCFSSIVSPVNVAREGIRDFGLGVAFASI